MSMEKKGRGRQKIEMKKMSNKSNLQVTFSKRRSGIFKKASELCTLCDANVAIVVFSPGEKVFSFGHPHVDTIIDRYLSHVPPQNDGTMPFIKARRNAIVCELNNNLTQINDTLDIEKKYGGEMSHLRNATESQFWWTCSIDRMNRTQHELFKKALEEFKKLVAQHAERFVIQGAPMQTIPFFVENGSNSKMTLHHQGNPQQTHLFGFNNMGESGGYRPSRFF
ncbi:hypothetical protein RYX36_021115 [Vicia faba]